MKLTPDRLTKLENKGESHGKRTLYKEGTYKKGNLHTHTTWSDGVHTPAETAKHYRSKGYDFLALTDHWVLRDSSGTEPG